MNKISIVSNLLFFTKLFIWKPISDIQPITSYFDGFHYYFSSVYLLIHNRGLILSQWVKTDKMHTFKTNTHAATTKTKQTDYWEIHLIHYFSLQILGLVWTFRKNSGRMAGSKY